MTTRAIRPPDALVREAPPASGRAVEQVAGVDDARLGHEPDHLVEVEPLELVPLGEHGEHRRTLAGGVGVGHHLEVGHLVERTDTAGS